LQDKIRSWLSPPDPWSNYNTARKAHHPGTAMWFTQGDTFGKWKSTGSLLWVNGLRVYFFFPSFYTADGVRFIAGSGKTIISYVTKTILRSVYSRRGQFKHYQRYPGHVSDWISHPRNLLFSFRGFHQTGRTTPAIFCAFPALFKFR